MGVVGRSPKAFKKLIWDSTHDLWIGTPTIYLLSYIQVRGHLGNEFSIFLRFFDFFSVVFSDLLPIFFDFSIFLRFISDFPIFFPIFHKCVRRQNQSLHQIQNYNVTRPHQQSYVSLNEKYLHEWIFRRRHNII